MNKIIIRIKTLVWWAFRCAPEQVGNMIRTTDTHPESIKVLFSDEILFYHKIMKRTWNIVVFEWHVNKCPYSDPLCQPQWSVGYTLTGSNKI